MNWIVDVANKASANTTVVMNKDLTVSAVFLEKEEPVVQFTLTMQVDGQGSTNPSVGAQMYNKGTVVSITATPSSGGEI